MVGSGSALFLCRIQVHHHSRPMARLVARVDVQEPTYQLIEHWSGLEAINSIGPVVALEKINTECRAALAILKDDQA